MENNKRRMVKSVKTFTEDLITEIISRVPAKDLTRFTCVSKAWCSLIRTDPYFRRLQIERTASLHRPFLLIQKIVGWSKRPYLIDLELIEDESVNLVELRHPIEDREADVVASCHGLLLLKHRISERMVVFNPTTMKRRMVAPNPAGDGNVVFCGFGYDRAHDRYKLVTQIRDTFESTFELMIYDFNNDEWYRNQWDRDQGAYDCFGIECVDGALYWCLQYDSSYGRILRKIVCFVLEAEEFHEVEIPDLGYVGCSPNTTVLDGRFGVAIEGWKVRKYEFWMVDMECDSNKAYSWRWTKILSLSNPILPPPYDDNRIHVVIPKCLSACKTRILFYAPHEGLFWYDLRNHEVRKLNNDPVDNVYSSISSFVPSLVGIGIL